jgi:hypothetical protein
MRAVRDRIGEKVTLSSHAQTLLLWARTCGDEGWPVGGLPDKAAVAELVAAGLVTEGENTSDLGYHSQIYAKTC